MLLTIIVPVYNAESYLSRCLDSLLTQALSEEELEIICVDDGSTDSSLTILQKYESEHACISVFAQENAGAGAARNVGLEKAKGEIITFCDADDYLIPGGLGAIINDYWNDEVDVLCHASTTLDAYKLRRWKETNEVSGKIISVGGGREIYQRDTKYFVWNTLIRRSYIEDHRLRFPPLRMTEDSCFMLELMMLNPRTVDVSSNIYRYTVNEAQVTRKREPELMKSYLNDYWYFLSRLKHYQQTQVMEFQKRPFYSRMFSASLDRQEYATWSKRVNELGWSMLPYSCYLTLSCLFRRVFIPFVLPHLSRG